MLKMSSNFIENVKIKEKLPSLKSYMSKKHFLIQYELDHKKSSRYDDNCN